MGLKSLNLRLESNKEEEEKAEEERARRESVGD
jgi:hypothetical protein